MRYKIHVRKIIETEWANLEFRSGQNLGWPIFLKSRGGRRHLRKKYNINMKHFINKKKYTYLFLHPLI